MAWYIFYLDKQNRSLDGVASVGVDGIASLDGVDGVDGVARLGVDFHRDSSFVSLRSSPSVPLSFVIESRLSQLASSPLSHFIPAENSSSQES